VSWRWLALLEDLPPSPAPIAAASVSDGRVLAAWDPVERPRVPAVKVDGRAVDPGGAPCVVSLVLAPRGVRIPFDDPAVQGARRAVLAGPPRRLVSTLLRGDSVFAGAITAAMGDAPFDDPFALIFPACLLRVGPGLLGVVQAPAGPVIERYGAGSPWPWDRFPAP
jgi:hypothetical protein